MNDYFDPARLLGPEDDPDDAKAKFFSHLSDGSALVQELMEMDSLMALTRAVGGLDEAGQKMALLMAVFNLKREHGMTEDEVQEWVVKDAPRGD